MKYIIIYLIGINIVTLCMYGLDKQLAKSNSRRIREATLLFTFPLLGGTIGAMLGMHLFHHKTKKMHFRMGLPVILILQIVLVVYIKFYGWS